MIQFLNRKTKARLQAKTVAQLRDFVGKLGGLQTEHQALRLRKGILLFSEECSHFSTKTLACRKCSLRRRVRIYSINHLKCSRVSLLLIKFLLNLMSKNRSSGIVRGLGPDQCNRRYDCTGCKHADCGATVMPGQHYKWRNQG